MKTTISDLMDLWQEELPELEAGPDQDLTALRARTLEKIRAAGAAVPRRRRRLPRVLAAAAVLAVCVIGVSAATGQLQAVLSRTWRNDTLVSSHEEAREDARQKGEPLVSGWTNPNGDPPWPLEEMVDSARSKADTWETEDCIGGTFGPLIDQWTGMDVTCQTGPVWSRKVYGLEHNGAFSDLFPKKYVKYEYTAQTPADLDTVLSGLVTLDTDWLTETYLAPDWANFYYQIYDSGQALRGEAYHALYTTPDGRYADISYDYAPGCDFSPSYRLRSAYDQAEDYTSATGLEAVICTKNGILWVDASTPEFLFSVVGGYLTVEEAKDILDHVTVRFAPEA